MTKNIDQTDLPTYFPISELAARSAEAFGDCPAMRQWTKEGWRVLSYSDLYASVRNTAQWLVSKGFRKNDKAAIVGENSPEWCISYLAIHMAGGVVVPIDCLLPINGVAHILKEAEAKVLFGVPKFLESNEIIQEIQDLKYCVNIGRKDASGATPLLKVIEEGSSLRPELPEGKLDDLAVILYTSGTTGHSKGVMLSHRNIMSNVAGASLLIPLGPGETFLSVLPLHHSLECTAGFLLPIFTGCQITFSRSMKSAELLEDIRGAKVTVMVGVPLLFEKLMMSILKGVSKKGKMTRGLFDTLMAISGFGDKFRIKLGRSLFASIRTKAGLGSLKYFVSGGGPLDPVVGKFFDRIGISLLQGYGMTETSPVTHINPPSRNRVETVGPTLTGVECRIGDPNQEGIGEVEIRGPNVFCGYYKNEEATEEVMTADGWLRTGDLGIIHKDGYLELKGRKKNIIVTGGGKNIYPEEIEFHLNRQKYILESLVLGRKRGSGYGEEVVAMIVPDKEQIELWKGEQGGDESEEEVINRLVKLSVDGASKELSEYKRIRKYKIMHEEFDKTPTRKIRRFVYSGDMVN